ncbi:hypothetical protein O3P69_007476 [Scylla paramamosain]|uniref:Uncharacterized protein n=1 Tax=Scylla paramamosain TaxID=85552 RepID=A0AAW0V4R6_SCYPA
MAPRRRRPPRAVMDERARVTDHLRDNTHSVNTHTLTLIHPAIHLAPCDTPASPPPLPPRSRVKSPRHMQGVLQPSLARSGLTDQDLCNFFPPFTVCIALTTPSLALSPRHASSNGKLGRGQRECCRS